MIRLASFGVLLLGGLIAFGAFYLARGSEAEVPQAAAQPSSPASEAPTPEVTTTAERLFYLQDIAFDEGDITLVLFGDDPRTDITIIRDQAALQAAKDTAYVAAEATGGQAAGSFVLALMGAPISETVAQIYRRDSLIASVTCINTACGSFVQNPDINHAGLLDHATPHQLIHDQFDDYATYMDTILAISENPDFMLLDQRPRDDFPAEPQVPSLTLALPTYAHPADTAFDAATHEALLQAAIASHLPDGASIERVNVTALGPSVIADSDNNQPVTAGGAPILFPDAHFYSMEAQITGITDLPADAYDQITAATVPAYDPMPAFAEFVTARLQTSCADCFVLKIDGPNLRAAERSDWQSEHYTLSYYDLREAP